MTVFGLSAGGGKHSSVHVVKNMIRHLLINSILKTIRSLHFKQVSAFRMSVLGECGFYFVQHIYSVARVFRNVRYQLVVYITDLDCTDVDTNDTHVYRIRFRFRCSPFSLSFLAQIASRPRIPYFRSCTSKSKCRQDGCNCFFSYFRF